MRLTTRENRPTVLVILSVHNDIPEDPNKEASKFASALSRMNFILYKYFFFDSDEVIIIIFILYQYKLLRIL